MSLTPGEVRNVVFKRARMGKGGFDTEQVDAFLDEVQRELARLIEENDDLRARVGPGGTGADGQFRAELTDLQARLDRIERERMAAEQVAAAMAAELQQAQYHREPVVDGDPGLAVLLMAQRTADEHVADARREADRLLSEARSDADELTREAQTRADAIERDAHRRHQAAIDGLDAKRTALLNGIEQLRQFERWYRSRLEAHLEHQMRDVDGQGRSGH